MGPLPVTTAQHTGRVMTLAVETRWPFLDIFSLIWDLRRMTLPPFLYEEDGGHVNTCIEEGGGHEVPDVTGLALHLPHGEGTLLIIFHFA